MLAPLGLLVGKAKQVQRRNGRMDTSKDTVDITARYIPQHMPPRYKPKLSMAMLWLG
jgi:hypothetical protein